MTWGNSENLLSRGGDIASSLSSNTFGTTLWRWHGNAEKNCKNFGKLTRDVVGKDAGITFPQATYCYAVGAKLIMIKSI